MPVEITGTWNGSASAPTINVTSVRLVPQSYTFAGQGRIGGVLNFTAVGTPGDMAINVGSLNRSFVVPLATVAMLLDPQLAFVAGIGALDSGGQFRTPVSIPNNPALVGLHVFGQSLIVPATGLPYTTSARSDFILPRSMAAARCRRIRAADGSP